MSGKSGDRQQPFDQKMTEILNSGALNLAIAIGYRTGLFDAMAQMDAPQSAARIARVAALNQRYVLEWLGVMVTGGIVELRQEETKAARYRLPPEHAVHLARNSKNANLAVYSQEIPLLTAIALEQIIESFRSGDGIPYSAYPRFQAFMAELSSAKHRDVLIGEFLPAVENGELIDRLKHGLRVCDLGCGEGLALRLMAESFPASRFVGIDISREAVERAKSKAEKKGLTNIEFVRIDAARIEKDPAWGAVFDYVTAFDAIHDQTDPLAALRGVRHMLAPNGLFSMIDIAADSDHIGNLDHPMGPFLYTVSLMHCLPVGLYNGGAGLGMMWGRQKAVSFLQKAGFRSVTVHEMKHDPFNHHFLCRR
jgi:ubiquinone/menaquinone biosynthesis C-methylase UbiE